MTDDVMLFEIFGGLLRQIAPETAAARRADSFRRVANVTIDILLTDAEKQELAAEQARKDEEEAARLADMQRIRAAKSAEMAAAEAVANARIAAMQSAAAKMRAFGLTDDEIAAIFG